MARPGAFRHGPICRIFVDARFQRRGIASSLLDEAEAQIEQALVSSSATAGEAFLFAVDGNDAAFRFYESRGWARTTSTAVPYEAEVIVEGRSARLPVPCHRFAKKIARSSASDGRATQKSSQENQNWEAHAEAANIIGRTAIDATATIPDLLGGLS